MQQSQLWTFVNRVRGCNWKMADNLSLGGLKNICRNRLLQRRGTISFRTNPPPTVVVGRFKSPSLFHLRSFFSSTLGCTTTHTLLQYCVIQLHLKFCMWKIHQKLQQGNITFKNLLHLRNVISQEEEIKCIRELWGKIHAIGSMYFQGVLTLSPHVLNWYSRLGQQQRLIRPCKVSVKSIS